MAINKNKNKTARSIVGGNGNTTHQINNSMNTMTGINHSMNSTTLPINNSMNIAPLINDSMGHVSSVDMIIYKQKVQGAIDFIKNDGMCTSQGSCQGCIMESLCHSAIRDIEIEQGKIEPGIRTHRIMTIRKELSFKYLIKILGEQATKELLIEVLV